MKFFLSSSQTVHLLLSLIDGEAKFFFRLQLSLTPMPRPGIEPTSKELHQTETFEGRSTD